MGLGYPSRRLRAPKRRWVSFLPPWRGGILTGQLARHIRGTYISPLLLTPPREVLTESRYVLDIGQSQDLIGLQLALAPCLLGYGALAAQLHKNPASKRTGENPYWAWIENYVAEDYVTAVKTGSGLLSLLSLVQPVSLLTEGITRAHRETRRAAERAQGGGAGQNLYPCHKGE